MPKRIFYRDEENPYDLVGGTTPSVPKTEWRDDTKPYEGVTITPDDTIIHNIDEASRRMDLATTGTIGTGQGTYSAGVTRGTASTDIVLWAGTAEEDRATAPFRVDASGNFVATSANITGTITATAGTIGGFEIGADYLRDVSNSFGLASTVTGGDDIRLWAGSTFANRATAPFRVTEAGVLVATSATITGSITATSGAIGGFTIGADYIIDNADSFGLASTVTGGDDVRFWAGNTFANRATAPFRVTEAGVLTASSGTIGGFTISTTTLTASNLVIDASNQKITIGTGANMITMDGATGIISSANSSWSVGGDGAFTGLTSSFLIPIQQGCVPTPCGTNGGVNPTYLYYGTNDGSEKIIRISVSNGIYQPDKESTTNPQGAVVSIGTYVYNLRNAADLRRKNADLSTDTAMTVSGTGITEANALLATDGTYLYVLDVKNVVGGGGTTVRKYSLSGTTYTWVADITLANTVYNNYAFACDGTNFYACTGALVVRRFNMAGVSQGITTFVATAGSAGTTAESVQGIFRYGNNWFAAVELSAVAGNPTQIHCRRTTYN